MKIKTKQMDYSDVLKLKTASHKNPRKPSKALKLLIKVISEGDLKKVNFKEEKVGMEKLEPGTPCLILMNHSCFLDLEIVSHLMYPNPYNIVMTTDGFVGKDALMRMIGCIPTQKFVTDMVLVKDMKYALEKLKSSVLLFPEASYSFDGTATPLPESLGKCIKLLGVPVVMIKTEGAYARDPLYNMLQTRKVDVSAKMTYLFAPEKIATMTAQEINEILTEQFSFDNFKWQQDNKVRIDEGFRADGLNRVLYKCPHCGSEGKMIGKGTFLECRECKDKYELDEYGYLKPLTGERLFRHIPDWYRWERECVRDEIEKGLYKLNIPVKIGMMVDRKAIYMVGDGNLIHDNSGFTLSGCNGKLSYHQKPGASYSLYSDYYWYEIGDVICIGDNRTSYYCFPNIEGDVVAKTRLAAEELYKFTRKK